LFCASIVSAAFTPNQPFELLRSSFSATAFIGFFQLFQHLAAPASSSFGTFQHLQHLPLFSACLDASSASFSFFSAAAALFADALISFCLASSASFSFFSAAASLADALISSVSLPQLPSASSQFLFLQLLLSSSLTC